jgi:hypothetical protein
MAGRHRVIGRREFLAGLGAGGALLAAAGCRRRSDFPGRLVGTAERRGHGLFAPPRKPPARRERVAVAILGSGVAGLSAAWKLGREGLEDFRVLELEDQAGGNCRFAEYPESRAPWAAHYLPVPTREARATLELLDDLGLVRGWTPSGDPIYDERHLCHAPDERLYQFGRWEEGLYPHLGATPDDLRQTRAFYAEVERWQSRRDKTGRRAFAIPVDLSSPEARELDMISMSQYLTSQGWTSERLRWHIEYGCRDDYGTSLESTSAWAGLHYFASRSPDRAGPPGALFTWPEGNGWLLQALLERIGPRLTTGALVYRIAEVGRGVEVDYLDLGRGEPVRLAADRVVCALPAFQRARLLEGSPGFREFTCCPWVVANLVLDRPPEPGHGFPLSWDNVIYDSRSLGYVVATHQDLKARTAGPTVLTWYRSFVEDPSQIRWGLLGRSWESFRDEILADLVPVHPDLPERIRRLDVMVLGHAMIRPVPGLVWGSERRRAALPQGRIHFAHSDLSGISLFEEAQYHGVRAAQEVLLAGGVSFDPSL